MKALVKIAFSDLKDGVIRQPGDTFDVTTERFSELEERLVPGSVEAVKAKRAANKKEE